MPCGAERVTGKGPEVRMRQEVVRKWQTEAISRGLKSVCQPSAQLQTVGMASPGLSSSLPSQNEVEVSHRPLLELGWRPQ